MNSERKVHLVIKLHDCLVKYVVYICVQLGQIKKKPLFPVSRPSLIFSPDPSTFYRI